MATTRTSSGTSRIALTCSSKNAPIRQVPRPFGHNCQGEVIQRNGDVDVEAAVPAAHAWVGQLRIAAGNNRHRRIGHPHLFLGGAGASRRKHMSRPQQNPRPSQPGPDRSSSSFPRWFLFFVRLRRHQARLLPDGEVNVARWRPRGGRATDGSSPVPPAGQPAHGGGHLRSAGAGKVAAVAGKEQVEVEEQDMVWRRK